MGAIQNYRGPGTAFTVFPLGFSPIETHDEHEFAITTGVKGRIFSEWTYDLSSTYGRDNAKVGLKDSLNVQLWRNTGSTQSDFYEGYLEATQLTTNLDISRGVDVGWTTPLNVAFGYENRNDGYAIGAGEPASIYRGGAQAFPGFTATDAGSHHRDNNAIYVDVAGSPVEQLLLDVAVRSEHYSDFGSETVGKLTGRYEFNKAVSVRGTVSSGFRAPTLAESYYSATQVSPTTATVLLPASSPGAQVVGLNGLKAEKSQNLSVGVVINPVPRLTLTLDAYHIRIDERILRSGTINGLLDGQPQPAFDVVNRAIAANGNTLPAGITSTGITLFSNAADTRDEGVDFVLSYAANYGNIGRVDWSIAANYNHVDVTSVKPAPSQFGSAQLLDQAALSNLETASPEYRVNLAAVWNLNDWAVDLRTNLFGPSSVDTTIDNVTYYENRIGTRAITDLSITKRIAGTWTVTVGANNLFDVYPDKLNPAYRARLDATGRQNVAVYTSSSPIGINGGSYFGSLSYRF